MIKDRGLDGRFLKGIAHPKERINLDIDLIIDKYFKNEMSTFEIGKELDVSQKTIENRLKESGYKLRSKTNHPQRIKEKISNTMKERGIRPKEIYSRVRWNKGLKNSQTPWNKNKTGLQTSSKKGKTYEELYGKEKSDKFKSIIKKRRASQVLPLKDTTIEIKIHDFLKQLRIEFATHQYMKEIEHAYQCDVLIPKQIRILQDGSIIEIKQKTIIECFGDYWHNRPIGREVDIQRCNELRNAGWRVLVFWESEIRPMELINLQEKLICKN